MSQLEEDLLRSTVRGFSRLVILWVLSRKAMSGYGVSKELKSLTGWSFNPGVVYPLLYDLEENGLIEGQWTKKGRRRIKCYSATANGCDFLNRIKGLLSAPIKEVLKDLTS